MTVTRLSSPASFSSIPNPASGPAWSAWIPTKAVQGQHALIERIIERSIVNRFLVLLLAVLLAGWGVYVFRNTPLDAIPDLSDVQVIIKTSYPGQAPGWSRIRSPTR